MHTALSATSPLPTASPSFVAFATRRWGQLRRLSGSIPPSGLVVLSSIAIQAGAALSKSLFDSIGAVGAAFVCKGFAALLLLIICRPRVGDRPLRDYLPVLLYGSSIAGMSLAVYEAMSHIPLGIVSALEFIGPLGVAVIGSRRPLDLVWVALAALGVIMLNPLSGGGLDPVGVGLALLSGGFWAGYILLSAPVGQVCPGGTGLALGMAIATVLMAPFGISHAGAALLSPKVVVIGLIVAALGIVIPFSMEFAALKRMPPRIFGVLMSIEPAIAALVGFFVLGEQLGLRSLLAIVLVTTAAIGVTLFGKSNPSH
ncbi:MAG TPA: EamA family transporter [Chroococcidiopsis sp.]